MSDIQRIYYNDFGIAFQWKQDLEKKKYNQFQVIFRDTGFYLTFSQLENFAKLVKQAANRGCCNECKATNNCRSILLKTPAANVDLAVSTKELNHISDLLEGTLFHIKLNRYLEDVCWN
ncbi:hypothetical protein C8N46_106218 [Kordia periserrulae]|uniref:Uncharacterized protein n=1 Tax=Kordia periserrulae TaxID=701523 RepID=A0A2T6BWX0_9FLAO|nr:DUF6686 family protein [Kordia periserrulae]PTX60572.1 hypothetical protein C8N46_106218 [Kordia periserrulae]